MKTKTPQNNSFNEHGVNVVAYETFYEFSFRFLYSVRVVLEEKYIISLFLKYHGMDHYVFALDSTEKQFQFRCFVFTWPIPFTFSYDSANLVSMFSLSYFRFESLCLRSFVLSFQSQTRSL